MDIDLRSRARWLAVPDGDDDSDVQQFAMGYDGYRLHGPGAAQLEDAVRHVVDMQLRTLVSVNAPTEDLRAALFALGRSAAHGWDENDNITRQPATQPILDELRARQGKRLLLALPATPEPYGCSPPSYELDESLHDSLPDLMLFSALQLTELDSDQMAWLGLTSKPEHALRDMWGWILQRALPSLSVTREWKRSDLAILDGQRALVLVEGKALYGFDALSPGTRAKYTEFVAKDLQKAQSLAPHAYVLASVVMPTVLSPWDETRTPSVAYAGGNRQTAMRGEDGHPHAVEAMWQALRTLGQVGAVDLGTGVALGSRVNTTLFLVRPRHRPTRPHT